VSDRKPNKDLDSAIRFLGRAAVAKAAGEITPEAVDGWRRRGEVPAKHCQPIVDAYRQKLIDAKVTTPTVHGLNPSIFPKDQIAKA